MNKYTQTYINELTKLAQDPVIAKPVPQPPDKAKQISDKLNALKSNVQGMNQNLPSEDKTKKMLGIPANAKPSEADLNDRAGYK